MPGKGRPFQNGHGYIGGGVEKGRHLSVETEWKKGHIPWNKGKAKPKPLKKLYIPWNKDKKNCFSGNVLLKMSLSHTGKVGYWKNKRRPEMTGEKHPNWNGGKARNKHSVAEPKYKEWRNSIFMRDNWKCKINNKDCKGHLEAHHILPWRDYPELRYDIKNGITLCQAHHPRKRAEEKRLVPFFMGLMTVSN